LCRSCRHLPLRGEDIPAIGLRTCRSAEDVRLRQSGFRSGIHHREAGNLIEDLRMTSPMTTSELPLKRIGRGKVRDIYEVDAERLLLVATDRVSAFDVVMNEAIPFKGAVLTQISAWWFRQLQGDVAHHLISADADEIAAAVP